MRLQKTIQDDIQTHVASMNEKLAKYKNDSYYKELLDCYDKFIAVNDLFKNNGVGTVKLQSGVPGSPVGLQDLDITKTNLALVFNKIIND